MENLLEKLNDEIDAIDDNALDSKEKLYLKYIELGLKEAYLYLGDLYYFDYEEIEKALDCYIKADIPQAIYMQGIVYSNAFYREQNMDKARECLIKAAELDVDDAIYELGFNYFNGLNGFTKDYDKAFEYFSKSAKNKNPEALCNLAQCYALGLGVEKDIEKAYKISREAFFELNNID